MSTLEKLCAGGARRLKVMLCGAKVFLTCSYTTGGARMQLAIAGAGGIDLALGVLRLLRLQSPDIRDIAGVESSTLTWQKCEGDRKSVV